MNKEVCLVGMMSSFRGATSSVDPPAGLLFLGGHLKKKNYNVNLFHIDESKISEVVNKIKTINPVLVGFSTLTGPILKDIIKISKELKKHTEIPVVWGGVHASLLPKETLKEKYVDFIVRGDGEETIVDLADALNEERDLSTVLGIGYKKEKEIVLNDKRPLIKNLDDYKPDWNLVEINNYIHEEPLWNCKKVISLQTSRGCPFRCAFCYNRVFTESTWRANSVEYVNEYIDWLKKEHGVDGLIINDDNFFVNKKRALEIIRHADVPIWAECHIKLIDENFIKELAKTKCKSIFLGIESGSDRSLKLMNKLIKTKDTVRVIRLLSKYPQITVNGTMIIGIPGETKKDIKKSIDFAVKISQIHKNMVLNIGTYMPYPGTEMYYEAVKRGFKPPKETKDWAAYDIVNNKDIQLSWLKWADKRTKKDFNVIDKCAIHLNRSEYGNWWQSIAKKILHYMALFRMKKKFFYFPIELYVFNLYYSWYLSKKLKK